VWAGAGDKTLGVNEDDSTVYESLKHKTAAENGSTNGLIRSMRTEPPATDLVVPEALSDLELVWDNSFEGNTGGFIFASQCGSLLCDQAQSNVNFDPLSLLADDIDLPQGTIVRGIQLRYGYRSPTAPRDDEFEGVVVSIYDNRTNAPGLPGGTDAPDNTPLIVGTTRFPIPVTDPDFLLISEGFANRRIEAVFPAGQQYVSDGTKKWIAISPVLDFNIPGAGGPQTFSFMTDFPLFNPVAQSFVPPDATMPWDFENPPNNPTAQLVTTFDTAFQLFGSAAAGGQTVISLFDNPSPSTGCTITLKVTQDLLSDCTSVACHDDPILGAG